ncbi:unnamed protein product [Cylindrotheca closterium]|uniref:Protein SMG7 n=1 Tax=Cylindrotheca closterium TaxID=2856 RepID=A0AAD2FX98_9STRA|nr:unnamed protein product [Cylindrotheca closterium]
MPDSQTHRPGVSLKRSPDAYISTKLKEAADLEHKLKASSDDNESVALQHSLCEVFGDILMSDPVAAKKNEISGRLWNVCFYSDISQLRSKISRAKRKKDHDDLKRLTREFKRRCEGGVALYDYLGRHFKTKLLIQADQSQTQDIGTQESSVDDSVEGISKSLEGVVESFFKVYIYLGDLHRYGENFSKAEDCYYNAVKLAPGKGNPYNQLAVVTQTKDPKMSCNALHWYCRSILATHQAFGTSPDNLERLFVANKGYLNEHSRNPKPPIYMPEKRKSSSELVRAQQQAATKSCLAHFVELLHEIIESRKPGDADDKDVDEEATRSRMSDVMASFESLLQATAFSDALLFKIVQICAFVCEICRTTTPISKELSRDFLLMTGATLATRLNSILTRMLEKAKAGSVRFLLPYQILCEYLRQIEESEGKEHDIFWKSFSEIANLVLKFSIRAKVAPNSYVLNGDINVPLKEYQQLRGYRPFNFLYKNYAAGNPFISAEDAVDALDLNPSQEHARNSAADINTTKIARFLAICKEYADNDRFPITFSDDAYSFVEKVAQDEDQDEHIDGADFTGSAPEVCDEDDAGDVVVFRAVEENVSDAFTSKQAQPPLAIPRNPNVANEGESETTHMAPPPEVLPPPAALLPPPGFTAPMHNPVSNQGRNLLPPMPPQQYPHPGVYGHVVQGYHMAPTPPPPPGMAPLQGVPAAEINGHVPFGQAWQVFGGPSNSTQSANPFAATMPIGSFGHAKPASPMFEDQHMTTDGTSLLDSALIDSLFMDDTKTNNPWK